MDNCNSQHAYPCSFGNCRARRRGCSAVSHAVRRTVLLLCRARARAACARPLFLPPRLGSLADLSRLSHKGSCILLSLAFTPTATGSGTLAAPPPAAIYQANCQPSFECGRGTGASSPELTRTAGKEQRMSKIYLLKGKRQIKENN